MDRIPAGNGKQWLNWLNCTTKTIEGKSHRWFEENLEPVNGLRLRNQNRLNRNLVYKHLLQRYALLPLGKHSERHPPTLPNQASQLSLTLHQTSCWVGTNLDTKEIEPKDYQGPRNNPIPANTQSMLPWMFPFVWNDLKFLLFHVLFHNCFCNSPKACVSSFISVNKCSSSCIHFFNIFTMHRRCLNPRHKYISPNLEKALKFP